MAGLTRLLSTFGLATIVVSAWAASSSVAAGDKPWRLSDALQTPDWLSLGGSHRTRFETLDGQFRAGRNGGDQVLVFRTTLRGELRLEDLRLRVELADSRATLADVGTPLSTGIVNTLELLQAYVSLTTDDLFADGATSVLTAGRVTMDVGSRRLVARNRFRDTINSFTGVDWKWTGADLRHARAFVTLPVDRRPKRFAALIDNQWSFDRESTDVMFWGLFYQPPKLSWGDDGEIYVFGLHERDSARRATRNRQLLTPGLRFRRPAKAGAFDYEIESVFQFGNSRASTAATDTTDLDHFAHFQHVEAGYTFDAGWSPRVAAQFDYASGDRDPNDGDNEHFDTLFGARRFDFGPTGIYGPFARANLISPGLRLQLKPRSDTSIMFAHRAYWLASDRDAWTTSGVRDATGATSGYLGQQAEVRLRWDLVPGNLQFEAGAAHLFDGSFMKNAPNATRQGDATYAYIQLALSF